MNCPTCKHSNNEVYDSRQLKGLTHRRRKCLNCPARWKTIEVHIEDYDKKALQRQCKEEVIEKIIRELRRI